MHNRCPTHSWLLLPSLLFLIQHQTEHIKSKLRILQAHTPKLLFGLMSKHMTPGCPERRNRLPDRDLFSRRLFVHKSRICNFTLGSGVCTVYFGMGEGFKGWQGELVCEGVNASVTEESDAVVIGR